MLVKELQLSVQVSISRFSSKRDIGNVAKLSKETVLCSVMKFQTKEFPVMTIPYLGGLCLEWSCNTEFKAYFS